MAWPRLRIEVVIIAFVVVLAAAFGARYLWVRLEITRPMVESFQAIAGVTHVQAIQVGQGKQLRITLGNVEDLAATYHQVLQVAAQYGYRPSQIQWVDKRDGRLEKVYYQMQYALWEGIATGKFTLMASRLEAQARQAKLERFRLYVDDSHVYLGLWDQGHYLYEIVPRVAASEAQGGR
ncbi:MAG: hypothetical protein IMW99_04270 [Firmicutes bacterium]|nr:hypothetical protein [Bacillota bacterium]